VTVLGGAGTSRVNRERSGGCWLAPRGCYES
jgi:hypothetical protein